MQPGLNNSGEPIEEYVPVNPPQMPQPPKKATEPHRHRALWRSTPMRTPHGIAPMRWDVNMADDLATHAEAVGLVHVDDLAALADANGMIAVADLPKPTKYFKPPEHGPDAWVNPGTWPLINEEKS